MKKICLFLLLVFIGCKKDKPQPNSISPAQLTGLNDFKINEAKCGYDSTSNTYYYPVPPGSTLNNYKITFDSSATTSILIDSLKAINNSTVNLPLVTNKQLIIQALDKYKRVTKYNLVITGLPIVQLDASQTIGDDKVSATFNLVDPNYVAQGSQLQITSNILISIRGATSRQYPKNSYLVDLVDALQNDVNVSLLGLRTDNSWILDAEYIDQARMRNRVCTDVWNSFNNVPYIASEPTALNGTRGYMVEVFLNKKYWGLYCLTEKIDRKQLQVKKSYGDMYKAVNWGNEVQFLGVSPYDNTSETWGEWQLEYPDIGDTPAPDWAYLYNAVNFVSTTTDAQFSAQIANEVDINNMVDYYIFMNVFEALDNQAKNTYFSFYDYRTASNFFYSVWDLDGTIGRNWDGSYLSNSIIGPGNNYLFQRLINLNPSNFKSLLKARWNALKIAQLSTSTVDARIEGYRQLLVNTNAFTRERAVWTNITQDLNTETTYMSNWYNAQYALFDSYVNSL